MSKQYYYFQLIFLVLLITPQSTLASKCSNFEDYATIESWCEGVPVYSLGHITYIYGQSPDLLPGIRMQKNNNNPVIKIKPKKSWEIESTLLGSGMPEPGPRSIWNESLPLLPIHLIDGDLDTIWASWGFNIPNARPEWIRIDLPMEQTISSVAMVASTAYMNRYYAEMNNYKRPPQDKVNDLMGFHKWAGRNLPKDITIQISKNAYEWETVFQDPNFTGGNETGATVFEFEPRKAKQIRIIGNNFRHKLSKFPGYSFSLAELEVRDKQGNNLALISRGASVTVSSTSYILSHDRFTQQAVWEPFQYDLGYKWCRLGFDMGVFQWNYVEMEKGTLKVDPVADQSITNLVNNGLNIVMNLDVKANFRYLNPPRKTDWRNARIKEINCIYYDHPGWAWDTPEMTDGYLRYVDYMVRHFKDRVTYYELGNEFPFQEHFYKKVVKAVKDVDPDAKIMLDTDFKGAIHILNTLCPGTAVRDGKLSIDASAMLVANNKQVSNGTIQVFTQNNSEVGIVLRYKEKIIGNLWHSSYILALYSQPDQTLRFHKIVDGQWSKPLGQIKAVGLGSKKQKYRHISLSEPNILLKAHMQGNKIIFSVSDSTRSYSTEHIFEEGIEKSGQVGVYRYHKPNDSTISKVGVFDDFQVKNSLEGSDFIDSFEGWSDHSPNWKMIKGQWMADVPETQKQLIPDAIGWHPTTKIDYGLYPTDLMWYFPYIKKWTQDCRSLGFKGKFVASEVYSWTFYPPGPPDGYSEMQRAKYLAQTFIGHFGEDVMAFHVEPYYSSAQIGESMLRVVYPRELVTTMHPDTAYYMTRILSTTIDGYAAQEIPVDYSTENTLLSFTFSNKKQDTVLVSAWIPGETKDGIVETQSNITIKGIKSKTARVIDLINGTEQQLNFSIKNEDTFLKNILIKDYPVLIELKK